MYTLCWLFFCKQKTADEMRISDWGSDVCSSDLAGADGPLAAPSRPERGCGRRAFAHSGRGSVTRVHVVRRRGPPAVAAVQLLFLLLRDRRRVHAVLGAVSGGAWLQCGTNGYRVRTDGLRARRDTAGLGLVCGSPRQAYRPDPRRELQCTADRKSGVEGKSVSGRLALGGRRAIKKKN